MIWVGKLHKIGSSCYIKEVYNTWDYQSKSDCNQQNKWFRWPNELNENVSGAVAPHLLVYKLLERLKSSVLLRQHCLAILTIGQLVSLLISPLALSQSWLVGREFVFELVLLTLERTRLDLLLQRSNFFIVSRLDVHKAVKGATLFLTALRWDGMLLGRKKVRSLELRWLAFLVFLSFEGSFHELLSDSLVCLSCLRLLIAQRYRGFFARLTAFSLFWRVAVDEHI